MKRSSLLVSLCLIIVVMPTPPVLASGGGCAVYRTSILTVYNNTWTVIPFTNERFDDMGCHSGSDSELYITSDGWYTIVGSVAWDDSFSNYLIVRVNDSMDIEWSYESDHFNDVSTVYYLFAGDYVELIVYQTSGSTRYVQVYSAHSPEFRLVYLGGPETLCGYPVVCSGPMDAGFIMKSLGNQEDGYYWDRSNYWAHSWQHEDGGSDEINVTGLSGILTDTQDAGWFQGLAITTTGVTNNQVLAWSASDTEWQPATISGTGSFTMPDIITATISGTVPVIITNTWHFTETLSSGHDMAIIRSFTYGEASIAIGLFVVAAVLGVQVLFALQRR